MLVFLDFAKEAFEKIYYCILFHKIKFLAITGKLGLWLHHFVTGHTQIWSRCSQWSTSGLSSRPLLFSGTYGRHWQKSRELFPVLICQWHQCQSSSHRCWRCTTTRGPQHSIWLGCNVQFNENKIWNVETRSELEYHGRNKAAHQRRERYYPTTTCKIPRSPSCNDCSFQNHIMQTVKKAKGMAGWVLRTYTSRKPKIMLTFWTTVANFGHPSRRVTFSSWK